MGQVCDLVCCANVLGFAPTVAHRFPGEARRASAPILVVCRACKGWWNETKWCDQQGRCQPLPVAHPLPRGMPFLYASRGCLCFCGEPKRWCMGAVLGLSFWRRFRVVLASFWRRSGVVLATLALSDGKEIKTLCKGGNSFPPDGAGLRPGLLRQTCLGLLRLSLTVP